MTVALFFVAASLLGFLSVPKAGVISTKESDALGVPFAVAHAANIASVVNNNALLGVPSSAIASTTTNGGKNFFVLPAPEFLLLGEVKDPGAFMNVALSQSGTVAYATKSGKPSDVASSLALEFLQ